ncbi:RluA family pseudouridine synthase [bacterium]|nr:RluA family pseudouridine synthase [bacterium]
MTHRVKHEFLLHAGREGDRLDKLITHAAQLLPESERPKELSSRSQVARLIETGCVTLRGKIQDKPGLLIEGQERVQISVEVKSLDALAPDPNIPLEVIYADEDLAVINKQAGLVVHTGAGVKSSTLVNALISHFGESIKRVGSDLRPGIVHRLDKDTSGLMVVALNQTSYQNLIKQFSSRSISRTYYALVETLPRTGPEIDAPIGRDQKNRVKMAVARQGGKSAVSLWKVEEELKHGYLLEVKILSGRTHQIRVHLKHVGAPIVGDQTYGSLSGMRAPKPIKDAVKAFGRQALHAAALELIHPRSGEKCAWKIHLPADMEFLVNLFREGIS